MVITAKFNWAHEPQCLKTFALRSVQTSSFNLPIQITSRSEFGVMTFDMVEAEKCQVYRLLIEKNAWNRGDCPTAVAAMD